MNEKEFYKFLGKIKSQFTEGKEFADVIGIMTALLDEGDYEDFFGTEGWRHSLGWD